MEKYEGKVNAPEFPDNLEWLNTDKPLELKDLHGKVVLLDFWTYCCINCMHIIPDLKRLEEKYSDELVVIGVHSAKFTTEQDTDNIRQAILRYGIEHPVVNDNQMTIWRTYGVRAWPTLVLVDPDGKIIGSHSGEGIFEPFDQIIGKVVEHFDSRGQLDRSPLELRLERKSAPATLLSFPGKVLADEASRKLFISDSNHNRIVIASLDDYSIEGIVGSGVVGLNDGEFARATFNHPQGMAMDGQFLYVADTENHAIRRVDLNKRIVETIAGTGQHARSFNVPGPGLNTPLNSPWDLALVGDKLYIAMAGSHQIWIMDLQTDYVKPYAGSGREARIDGPLSRAALAQPSGLTSDGKKLYFADSEVSSIRSAGLDNSGSVETLAGGDLFDFGDKDAAGLSARLQHPLGVAIHDGILYVADTYNNKIKRLTIDDRRVVTFAGTGEEGMRDGSKATFDEPGGVSVAQGKLYVADTNNHVIRVVDIDSGYVETLKLRNTEKLKPSAPEEDVVRFDSTPQKLIGTGNIELRIDLELPDGMKLNELAVSTVEVSTSRADVVSLNPGVETTYKQPEFPLTLGLQAQEGTAAIRVLYSLYYCRYGEEGLCFFKEGGLEIPLKVAAEVGEKFVKVDIRVD